jgi:hypothetical protein
VTGPVIKLPTIGQEISEGLAPLLNALFARQQLGLQRQALQLEQQRTSAQVESAQAATAEARADLKKKLADMEQQALDLQARDLASESWIGVLSGGPVTPEAIAAAQTALLKRAPPKAKALALQAFNQRALEDVQRRTVAAQATQEEAQAATAAEQARATLEATQAQASAAAAQAAASGQNATANVGDAALRLALSGVPLGDVRRTYNMPRFGGSLPDDTILTPADAAKLTEQQRIMQGFSARMRVSNDLINEMGGRLDARATAVLVSPGVVDFFVNPTLSSDQQRLLAASRQYVNDFIYASSGKQINEKEAARLVGAVIGKFGDKPAVLQQKAAMREIINQTLSDISMGLRTPADALTAAVEQAGTLRVGGEQLDLLKRAQRDAQAFTRAGAGYVPPPNPFPSTPTTLPNDVQAADSLLDARIRVRPDATRSRR